MAITSYKYATEGLESSMFNKVKELLLYKDRLVLVQEHELQKLKGKKTLSNTDTAYINYLFTHYILNSGEKTYNIKP